MPLFFPAPYLEEEEEPRKSPLVLLPDGVITASQGSLRYAVGERDDPRDSGTLPGVSMISSWVGVPAASSLTGVPSTPSGLTSPKARLKFGLPCKKLLIFDSRLGGETEGAVGRGGGGGGGGESCFSFSRSRLLPGVSRLKLLVVVGFVFGVVGLSRVLTADDSGEVLVGGAEEVLVTLCNREDKPEPRQRLFSVGIFHKKRLSNLLRTCASPGVFALERALRMPSGVMSTRDRMLANAGLEGGTLEDAACPEGVEGVPVGGGAGLAAEKMK